MSQLMVNIGKAVGAIRASLQPKVTQEELAHRCGLHRNTIQKLERGKNQENMGIETVENIAAALGVSLVALLEQAAVAGTTPTADWLDEYERSPYRQIDKPTRAEYKWLRAGAVVGWVGGPPSPKQIHQAIEARRSK